MKNTCERPYRTTVTTARALHDLPSDTPDRQIRALAAELAEAVCDLDARMRAGLVPPQAWRPAPAAGPTGTTYPGTSG